MTIYISASRFTSRVIHIAIFGLLLWSGVTMKANSVTYDFPKLVDAMDELLHKYHYHPAQLQSAEYQRTLKAMYQLATEVASKDEFITGINRIWQDGPFSHVVVANAQAPAEQFAEFLDNMRIGAQATSLRWQGDTAVLTINTMMGTDTIDYIDSAYDEIEDHGAKALIIDLRNNEGGAFATRPMVSHLISEPLEVGYFISKRWTDEQPNLPTRQDLQSQTAWDGWSIRQFWQDVQQQAIIKVVFQPTEPHISVPVFVLTSNKTASAAEFAIDALKSTNRITIVGEPTAGEMLSQKPFDLAEGLHFYLPVADYYSLKSGRIEGSPIVPDVSTPAAKALQRAIEIIATLAE